MLPILSSNKLLILSLFFFCSSCVSLNKYQDLEERIAQLEKTNSGVDLTDTDADGVIDVMDQELDSEAGCPVDTRGITLDSDGDGYLDCKDREPYSPPGYEVDDQGIAQVPAPSSLTKEDVHRIFDSRDVPSPMYSPSQPISEDIDFPSFPWKPPTPSATTLLKKSKYFPNAKTYGDMNDAIKTALGKAGFPDSRNYFQIHTDKDKSGFALVTHIEQMDENGNVLAVDDRFNSGVARTPGTGMLASLMAMWQANVGHFRIYVFIVMDGNVWPSGAIITKEEALTKDLTGGAPDLHKVIAGMPVTENVECAVFLYEFVQHENDKNGELVRNPKLDVNTQLKKSGILEHLGK